MPIYVYEAITNDDQEPEIFEFHQRMHEDAYTEHPETGVPIRRIVTPPNIGGKSDMGKAEQAVNDDGKLEKLGFTKYVKAGDGTYEKTVGKGPSSISGKEPGL